MAKWHEWHSCSARMPEDGRWIWITDGKTIDCIQVGGPYRRNRLAGQATHWMLAEKEPPLPG